jgi:PAS domain S-box-containing protein
LVGLFYLAGSHFGWQLWALHFNAYGLLSLAAFATCASLLLYFMRLPARGEERVWLSVFLAGLCIFTGSEMLQRFSMSPEIALFWTTLSAAGLALVPAALYLFGLAYTNQSDRRYPGTTMTLLAGALIVTFFYSYTSIVFNNDAAAMKLYPWGYNNDPAAGLAFTLGWIDLLFLLTTARLIHFRRHTRNAVLRKQSLVFIFAALLPILGGTITDGVLPSMGIDSIPPTGVMLTAMTALVLTYGVLRYQLATISPTLFSGTILSIMHESVVVADAKFRILYMNPEAEMLLGLRDKTNVQKTLVDFVSPDGVATFRQAFESGARDAVHLDHVDLCRTPADKTPVRITGSRLQSTDLEAHVLVLTDITAELRTKSVIEHQVQVRTEELREARAYLVASINSLEQGFILVGHDFKVELTNGMAQHLMKQDGEKAGKPLAEAVASIDWDVKLPATVQRVLSNKRAEQLEATAPGGRFYAVFVTPMLSGREALGAAVIIEDVTEQRILERSRDEFFSIASHELRTPLTAIRGNLSMAEAYFPKAMKDKELATMIGDAHDASIRLIDIVNDFLDSSRLEQGKMQFQFRAIALNPLLKTVAKDLAPLLAERHNTLSVTGFDNVPAIYTDAARLQQILFNVVGNAAKYSEDSAITVKPTINRRSLWINVADHGKGISPENQAILFHKFQQAGDSILTRDNTKGTGLGLYISKLLATNMGGDVALAQSEVGKGSMFVISLPLATKKELAATTRAAA